MNGLFTDMAAYLLAASLAGAIFGWLIRTAASKSKIASSNDSWQAQLDNVVRQRDQHKDELTTLRTSIEAQEAVIHQRDMAVSKMRTELESALEKEKGLTKGLFTLRAEREDFKSKMASFQNRMASLQSQSNELQSEFLKSRDFYVGELT